ncbi:fluoride efflux transporter CrcB [Alcanivorax quisquiliarum]|uniref:Fluoride-specific ion channel FluC n=1 Tax=Alcanivorax quisquiliarum TaxID=2933565 RepID=A0ABT0E623_9GAMM|nr:fluoride efflux transporter CrcB [Alcanivorax quisquiliarum]MCK0537225.1 fluoride efflux transporter CrcB [Alcanivorax quisquiliarum]
MGFLVVFAGGGLGAVMRYGVSLLVARLPGNSFHYPLGTLLVNIIGSLLLGVLVAWWATARDGVPPQLQLFFVTGVLGGFTTFSAFSLEVVSLYTKGEIAVAGLYIGSTLILGIGALYLGMLLARQLAS